MTNPRFAGAACLLSLPKADHKTPTRDLISFLPSENLNLKPFMTLTRIIGRVIQGSDVIVNLPKLAKKLRTEQPCDYCLLQADSKDNGNNVPFQQQTAF